jgi:co-chaperonin GroES (HSP10)
MKLVPQNDYALCKCITENKKTLSSGFVYETNDVKLYEIIDISHNFPKSDLNLKIGDIIRTNSTGTAIKLDNIDYIVFKHDSIVGKVID